MQIDFLTDSELPVHKHTSIFVMAICCDVSLSWCFDWQARLTVICRGGSMKATVGRPLVCFFFVVFFSMEPIREEILKQIAAACSVSGGVLRFDPVKLA